ncbi:MAG: hypothetical protein J0H67_09920 [Rhodospirillales bacterium]|nr:hypothetical protein [Rhodospirillales bacterium]
MQTPDGTLIGSGGAITDAGGHVWTIDAQGRVVIDPTTANVTHLAYAEGLVWQENTQNLWWAKSSPTASWMPPAGTQAPPVPIAASANDLLVRGEGGVITDASGNRWTIVAGQVVVNGVVDPTTANVGSLAYVDGQVWQQNQQGLWWAKSSPAAAWSPPAGTATTPYPVASMSPDQSVIGASTVPGLPSGTLVDAHGVTWSIANGQVMVDGVADPTSARVIELAYVNGRIWQENADHLWWSKAAPNDAWSPGAGTSANPLTGGVWIFDNAGSQAIVNLGPLTHSVDGGSGLAPQSTSRIVTPEIDANGSAITVSSQTATVVVTGDSHLTDGATLTLIGAYRTPQPIYGPLENDGRMTLDDSTLRIGALSGSGTLAATGSNLTIQSAATSDTIQLQAAHLAIGGPAGQPAGMTFLAPISMDAASDLTVLGLQATSEVIRQESGHMAEVMLYDGTTEVADLKVSGVAALYASQTGSGAGAYVTLSTSHGSHDLPLTVHTS